MKAYLKTWVPLAALLCACGSSANEAGRFAAGDTAGTGPGSSSGTTSGGDGTGTSVTSGGVDPSTTGSGSVSVGTTGTTTGPSTTVTGGAGGSGGSGAGGAGGGSADSDAGTEAGPRPEPPPPIPPGILTVGAWDDNRNYDWFTAYRTQLGMRQVSGILPFAETEFTAAHDGAMIAPTPHQKLDISLVIDTTGSMTDELHYLQSEFLAFSSAIHTRYPNAEQRWSLIVYRDVGDEYVVRPFDFTTDTQLFRANLAAQVADGGGDFPEAPERALAEMNKFAWRTDPGTAKLAFWVGDAPHHAQNAQALATAIGLSRAADIHIYPVASSGVDEFTELTMRMAAQLTHGRYLFLTNDSGVGGDHKEPSIPCYFVTKLDIAIQRMVDIEMTGTYREPTFAEILRRGGNPQNGACTLASGKVAQVF